jgi:enamine deaminase RidA (YjgF/YER057c/UK114 family)
MAAGARYGRQLHAGGAKAGELTMRKVIVTRDFANYPADWHLSPGLDTGDFIFFSGITGVRSDKSLSDDPETQFRDAFGFLKSNLAEAGLDFSNIVEMTTYHVELRRHLDKFIKVKDEFVSQPYPAWSAIGVTELITNGTLIEIRVIARRG